MLQRISFIGIVITSIIALTAFNTSILKTPYFPMSGYLNSLKDIVSPQLPTTTSDESADIHKMGTDDGWHGVIKDDGRFPPEAGRYHLYIGLFCPFAHRANLVRYLKGLEDTITISVVKPYPKGDAKGWPGWQFAKDNEYPDATIDHLFNSQYLHEVYFKADPEYKGRYSVPLLWDKKSKTIVNNDSAEMLRWLPMAFNSLIKDPKIKALDLYPEQLRSSIDKISIWIQRDLNSGVYKAGFAPDQETYDQYVIPVFAALNTLEQIIHNNGGPYILGKHLTELDIRAYATVVRFDTVYEYHFKCNLGTIRHNYPNINAWLKNLYWNHSAFKNSTNFKHIKENYTKSHGDINPKAITPLGPYPSVEELEVGFQTDFSKLLLGGVGFPSVVEAANKLQTHERL